MKQSIISIAVDLWQREPARLVALAKASLALGLAFGLRLSIEQQSAILGFALVVIALGEVTRSQVTPTVKAEAELAKARLEAAKNDGGAS